MIMYFICIYTFVIYNIIKNILFMLYRLIM